MCNARGELAERGQLFGLDEAVLRGAEIIERCEVPACAPAPLEQSNILDGDDGLVGEGLTSSICLS